MGFSDFEKQLGAEPRETAATLAARGDSDAEQAAAAKKALAFENQLEAALAVPVDEPALLASILETPASAKRTLPPRWLAIAASLLLVVGVSSTFFWQNRAPQPVADFVQSHYQHDGAEVLAKIGQEQSPAEVQAVLASLGVQADKALRKDILYIKFCPTPDSRGAHMVLATEAGPATVIFMPAVRVDKPMVLSFDQTTAEVVGLEQGAAAIIGADPSVRGHLEATLRKGLRPDDLDT